MPIQVPNELYQNGIHRWQEEVIDKFDNNEFRFAILKWHRRARKTSFAVNLLIREAMSHKNHVYLYIAPTYKQAKSIIWRDPHMLFFWLPPKELGYWEKREDEMFIRFKNGSLLILKGADDPDSIRGISCDGVVFDEWSLQKYIIWSEIIRPIMMENKNRWSIFLYTPKPNIFTIDMEEKALDEANTDWFYSKLPVSTSKLLDADELAKARLDMLPSEYEQEMECSDLGSDQRVLITPQMIEDLNLYVPTFHTKRRIVACDPSAGGDECPIFYIVNGEIVDQEIFHERNAMIVAGYIANMCAKHSCNNIILDTIGNSIYDNLVLKEKYYIQDFNSSASSSNKERFKNLRAEAWYYTMEQIQSHNIPSIHDRELIKQLTCVPYKVVDSNGKLQIDSKRDIKKNLHYSPDRADCFIYAIYGLQNVEEEGVDQRLTEHNRSRRRAKRGSAMAS